MGKAKKVLLCTLGTGDGSEIPAQKSIKDLSPDSVIMFASSDSVEKGMADKVKSVCAGIKTELVNVQDCNQPDEIYLKAFAEIRKLLAEGTEPMNIHINYTAGTKAMSVGIVLAGVAAGCVNFHYVGGMVRDKTAGRVKKGFESTFKSTLSFVTVDHELKNAASYFSEGEFIAARNSLNETEERFEVIKNGNDLAVFLDYIIEAYHLWQIGDYEKAQEKMKKVNVTDVCEEFFGLRLEKTVAGNKEVLNMLTKKPQLQVFDRAAAALRAAEKGYYSFAAEDIYSSLEYMTAYILKKKGVNKGEVDPVKLSEAGIESSDFITKKGGIGLYAAFQLLEKMGDEIGKKFIADKDIYAALKIRNEYIHSGKPVRKKDAERFYETAAPYYDLFLKKHGDMKDTSLVKFMEKFRFPKI